MIKEGKSWSDIWIEFDKNRYSYDENFISILDYTTKNNIKNNEI